MKSKWIWLIVLGIFLLTACKPITPIPTPTLLPSATPSPTLTPTRTPTITPVPTLTPQPKERGIFTFNINGENLQQILVGDYNLPRFTPDGQKFFVVERKGDISNLLIYDRETDDILVLYSVTGEIKSVEVAPEKTLLAFLVKNNKGTEMIIFDYGKAKEIERYLAPEGFLINTPLSWSYNAQQIAFTQCTEYDQNHHRECHVHTWNTERGEKPNPISAYEVENSWHPQWSPSDVRLAFCGGEEVFSCNLYIIDLQQTLPKLINLEVVSNTAFLWTPDASQFLLDGVMVPKIFDIESKSKERLFDGGIGHYTPIAWLPNGITIHLAGGGCGTETHIVFFDPSQEKGDPYRGIPPYYSYFSGSWITQFAPDFSKSTNEITFVGIYNPTVPHPWD